MATAVHLSPFSATRTARRQEFVLFPDVPTWLRPRIVFRDRLEPQLPHVEVFALVRRPSRHDSLHVLQPAEHLICDTHYGVLEARLRAVQSESWYQRLSAVPALDLNSYR